jgi:light-regulated signal transduction histidine kinase (bacteriophytochrome)
MAQHLLKKGYPRGHVNLYRWMSIPVFSEDKIVAVVGIANKDIDYGRADVRQLTLLMESVWKYAERERAQEVLKQRTDQVEAANREIEAFSYSISHDLKAPLRILDGFSLAVLEDCGDKLDEKGRDYLNRIRNASQKMAQLIDDILKLSRITMADMNTGLVNLSNLAESIAADIKATQPERHVEFVIQPEMTALGDIKLLDVALRNLMENSWKYTNKSSLARIELGVNSRDGKQVYFLADNGAGFDLKYADRLFQPFRRLHSDEEFPGTGIGLATVQRVIHRHGGRIWADSEIGKGATFYFTLD